MCDSIEYNEIEVNFEKIERCIRILKQFHFNSEIFGFITEDQCKKLTMKLSNYEFDEEGFGSLLRKLVKEKKLSNREVLKNGEIDESYYYQLMKGSRNPSRDKVIQICFGLKFTEDESDVLLERAGYVALSCRTRRDCAIRIALNEGLNISETNYFLNEINEQQIKICRE